MAGGPLLLGIDGGQTATKALLARADGRVLATGRGGPSDHFHAAGGEARNRGALHGTIASVLSASGAAAADVAAVALGLTGAPSAPEAPAKATAIVRERLAPSQVLVVADYVTNLAGASGGAPGVVVIAGGGSIAFGAAADGRQVVAGGFGYLLGDEGSAYDIGRRAIVAAARASDGRGPATVLERRILAALDLGEMREAPRVVYREGFTRDRVAHLAPLVAEAAREGDAVAADLVKDASGELALAALAVLRRLFEPDEPATVYPTGGVFAAGEVVRGPFRDGVTEGWATATVAEPAFPPVVGALILAARVAGVATSGGWLGTVAATLPEAVAGTS